MIYFAFIISLVTCSIAIMVEYRQGEPKRSQMLLFWIMKPIIEHREAVQIEYNKKLKDLKEYTAIEKQNAVDESKLRHYEWLENCKIAELNRWKEKKLAYEWYLKPLFICVYCMPSFWGSVLWVAHFGFTMPIEWLTTIVMSVFINAFIWNLYLKTE